MQKSVLEAELSRKLAAFRAGLRHHDRAVLLGFIFSLVPLLPVTVIGLLVGLMNYGLYRAGKLDIFERKMIVIGLWIGVTNSALGIAVTYYAAAKFGAINWDSILQAYLYLLREFKSNLPIPGNVKDHII